MTEEKLTQEQTDEKMIDEAFSGAIGPIPEK